MTTPEPSGHIRPAVHADGDGLFRLASLLATPATPERAAFDSSLRVILSDESQCLLVADVSTDLVAYIHGLTHPAFHANGNIGWVEELYVDDHLRGSGLGRELMGRFERWAVETADVRYLAVATRRAGSFYDSIGYHDSATYFKKLTPGSASGT